MITVVDYGVGNLMSVSRAFEAVGAQVRVSASPAEIGQSERLVVPGVGAFGDGMRALIERDLVEPIKAYAASGRPMLGICLGMQLLFDSSEEFGEFGGLALIPGRVRAVPARTAEGRPHKIPHIGWSGIVPARRDWRGTLLEGVASGAATYFVHSFAPVPADERDRLADTHYDGCLISAVVQHGAIVGCQFHPEKSAAVGLKILANFAAANV
jgi:imidazole glycerol-phosphate synthase subunit HisH